MSRTQSAEIFICKSAESLSEGPRIFLKFRLVTKHKTYVRVRPFYALTTRVKLSYETFGLVVRRMDGRAEVEGSSPLLRTTGSFVY